MSHQIWSATPTPLTQEGRIDVPSISRMINHHLRLGVNGIMLCGSCGEGPWLSNRERETLIKESVATAAGRIPIAVQITDNSAERMLEFSEQCADWKVDRVVVAQPYLIANKSPRHVFEIIRDTIRHASLPAGLYDRGLANHNPLEAEFIPELLEEKNLTIIKDSSVNAEKQAIYLDAVKHRPEIMLFSGGEFDLPTYINAGYRGVLLGGAIFNAALARQIIEALEKGDQEAAKKLQERMNELMWIIYGGKKITCWLSGLKHLLIRMNVFSTIKNIPRYTLTDICRDEIDALFDGNDPRGFLGDLLP